MRLQLLLGLMVGFFGVVRGQSPYTETEVAGFKVRSKADCFAGAVPAEVRDFQAKLRAQIDQLNRVLPADKLQRLRQIPLYVHKGEHRAWGAAHHPSREWLVKNGYPAEMANSIEIFNWSEFRTLVETQPACLLHEYAHGWQHLAPGMTQLIKPAYQQALRAGLYQSVDYVGEPSPRKAYALENDREYFAELSEAYFGRNDFFPFVRGELQAYDPAGYAMIERVWGVR
ncbi:hypothetical protein Verru16b_02549 [Lacunisphaera limnophila]|uniref:Uncharacterized protein n=2 Tax=Lacunisphaera limnophila TaxID=1838286 RepID=A0A1D8AX48_9BACT|nr:hypothetical protein Verru16b_02549 [Lacunisphaera limnophila]